MVFEKIDRAFYDRILKAFHEELSTKLEDMGNMVCDILLTPGQPPESLLHKVDRKLKIVGCRDIKASRKRAKQLNKPKGEDLNTKWM